jgi:predicted nucleic acid-binding protein
LLYLSHIDQVRLLPQIFQKVLIPQAVADELSHPSTPEPAAALIERCPFWLEICTVPSVDPSLGQFGAGERKAITLALSAGADLLLVDDLAAKSHATQTMHIAASGRIGVLYAAVIEDLIPFTTMDFDRSTDSLLRDTNFRSTETLRRTIKERSRKLHALRSQSGLGT